MTIPTSMTWIILGVFLIQLIYATWFYVYTHPSRPVQVARFTALNLIQYIYSDTHRHPERTNDWNDLMKHMTLFAKSRSGHQMPYSRLRASLHLHCKLILSSPLHAMIDELLNFAESEARSHGIVDMNVVDGVKLCKKITEHPLLK